MSELSINSKYVLPTGHEIPLLGYGVWIVLLFPLSNAYAPVYQNCSVDWWAPIEQCLYSYVFNLLSPYVFSGPFFLGYANRPVK